VAVIDPAIYQVIKYIPVGTNPKGIAVSPDGRGALGGVWLQTTP
jgi:DNA-binding beta-propeller fold protein YncE